MPTVQEILNYFPTACVLAGNDVAKSSLNGQRLDNSLPKKMYAVYFVLNKIYSINSNFIGITAAANYLWELMGKYGIQSMNYQAPSSGNTVIPSAPTLSKYLIPIKGYNFKDATQYDNPLIVGKQLAIYWNDVSRYLFSTEFALTSTGINITADGFDAVSNPTYELFIYIINP